MSINDIYIIFANLLAIWGVFLTVFIVLNGSLKKELLKTKQLIDKVNFNQIKPKTRGAVSRFYQRLFDSFIIFFTIPVFVPATAIIGILIRLESRGPVFLAHKRTGLNGKTFWLYKFRTTFLEKEESEAKYLRLSDKRITKVGKFLKESSLEFLPSFFNVVNGDMSLIGRSNILDNQEAQNVITPEIRDALLSIRPGVISLWSVSYDNIRSNFEYNLFYDIVYLEKMSPCFDLKVLLRSMSIAFGLAAAY